MTVIGVAEGAVFQSYQLHFASGENPPAEAWQPVEPPQTVPSSPARESGGLLGVWHTEALAPGKYTLRLTVLAADGASAQAQVIADVLLAP